MRIGHTSCNDYPDTRYLPFTRCFSHLRITVSDFDASWYRTRVASVMSKANLQYPVPVDQLMPMLSGRPIGYGGAGSKHYRGPLQVIN